MNSFSLTLEMKSFVRGRQRQSRLWVWGRGEIEGRDVEAIYERRVKKFKNKILELWL